MSARRARPAGIRPGPLALVLAAALLAGCGQATGPDAGTTEDDMSQDEPSQDEPSQDEPSQGEPDVLLPSSPPVGAAELPVDPAGAELTVVVGGPDAPQGPLTLSCDWRAGVATGSHPDPEQACADLLSAVAAGNPFAPVPADAMCTQLYGGDATAEVTGAVLDAEGGPVDVAATYSLTDGCEIDRWRALGAVLAPWGGAA